jgi:hypothetical protein
MKLHLLQHAKDRLSPPQYEEFYKVINANANVTEATRIYWLDYAGIWLEYLGYSEYEIARFIGEL